MDTVAVMVRVSLGNNEMKLSEKHLADQRKDSRDYVDFIEENEQWIDDYALYMAKKS